MSRLFFVAPLPPPVHGFSVINREMLGRLREGGRVEAFDLAPGRSRPLALASSLLRFAAAMAGSRRPTLYLALSGGGRQWIDLCFIVLARIAGARIFIHHHSFAYLNRRPRSARLVMAAAGPARHIVLCRSMGQVLAQGYGLDRSALRVLSNAAFMTAPPQAAAAGEARIGVKVGYLSAVSAEKGAFTFLDTIAAASRRGLPVAGLIAGPVAPAEAERFAAALAAVPQARHLGPLYGEDKERFLAGLDVLLFPTSYVNEAEPVTIWEALGHGIPIVANARGCIAGMVPEPAGWIVGPAESFVERAVEALAAVQSDPQARRLRQAAARAQFEAARHRHSAALASLLAEMAGGEEDDAAA